jgi:hypothetical protein
MSRKDETYKLACEYANNCAHTRVKDTLEKYKSKLKIGKADSVLKFYMGGNIGERDTQIVLKLAADNHENISSCTGYEEIRKSFPEGICVFQGTLYLKRNREKFEDFSYAGNTTGLVINNPKMSDDVIIKSNTGRKVCINKKDEKASMFLVLSSKTSLPYDVSKWGMADIDLLTSGTPLSRREVGRLVENRLGPAPVKTVLQQFLDTRTMNLKPSKRQLARIDKLKKKMFGSELEEERIEVRGHRYANADEVLRVARY